nr:endoplasmic reticulum aminopeptidase 2 [Drosophila kikkawai]
MTLFIKTERNHIVWNPVFTFIDQIGRRIEMSSVYKKFELYVIALLAPIYESLGTPKHNEVMWKTDFRKLCKTFLCRAGYLPCINTARKSFELWINSSNPNFENPVPSEDICPVFKLGSMNEWMFGLERIRQFPKLRPQSDRTYLLKMLARCPVQHEKILYLLKMTILSNNSIFTETDQILIINAVASGFVGYTTLLNIVSDNWIYIRQKYQNNSNFWNKLISSATGMFSTQDGYEMVKSFYNQHIGEFGTAQHIIEKSIRNIKVEVVWSEQNLPIIEKWIEKFLSKQNQ